MADGYAAVFARPSLAPLNKALVYLGSRGLGLYNLSSSQLSGEEYFLASLAKTPPRTILDVGANHGDYVMAAQRHFPSARIIAFEPHPQTFKRLSDRCGATAECFNLAVDATSGLKQLFDLAGTEGTQLASMNREAVELPRRTVTALDVDSTTLDEFCSAHAIEEIDLLKIDTEGSERHILEGGRRLISEGRIGWIQFEFNEMNVASRSFLKDFVELLPNHSLSRLLPSARLELDDASPFYREVFGYQNIIAAPRRPRTAG